MSVLSPLASNIIGTKIFEMTKIIHVMFTMFDVRVWRHDVTNIRHSWTLLEKFMKMVKFLCLMSNFMVGQSLNQTYFTLDLSSEYLLMTKVLAWLRLHTLLEFRDFMSFYGFSMQNGHFWG